MSNRNPSSRWPRITALAAFFGRFTIGDDGTPTERWEQAHLTPIHLPFPMRLAWDADALVRKIKCHREVAASLSRCLDAIAYAYPDAVSRRVAGVDTFGCCYQYRAHRGTHLLSLHAYGAAFDFCLRPNKQGKVNIPPAVVDIFKAEGWAWGGDRKERPEPGHFEAINRS